MEIIFHITNQSSWEAAKKSGRYEAASLKFQGFIHCSTGPQVCSVADFIFKGQKDLILLAIDSKKITSSIVFEGETQNIFPHIYGPIDTNAVLEVINFASDDQGLFELPTRAKNICPYFQKLKQLLMLADTDPGVAGFVNPENENLKRLPIWCENQIVGFATPREDKDGIWRMGAIYVHPDHRARGLARKAIADYITGTNARAFLEENNLATQKAFWAAGFRPYQYDRKSAGAWWSNYNFYYQATVVEGYEISYKNPIHLRAGEKIKMGKAEENPAWKGWHWCETPDGNSGWISEFYFKRLDEQFAQVLFPYQATELQLSKGQKVYIYNQDRGWAWCSKDDNKSFGWVPLANLI